MKLALRVFAMMVVLTGLSAAPSSSASSLMMASHLTASVDPGPFSLPAPGCGPGVPGCPQPPNGGGGGGN